MRESKPMNDDNTDYSILLTMPALAHLEIHISTPQLYPVQKAVTLHEPIRWLFPINTALNSLSLACWLKTGLAANTYDRKSVTWATQLD